MTVGCARCHDHMFDPIRQKDYYRLQAYLGATHEYNEVLASEAEQERWKEENDRITKEIRRLGRGSDGLKGPAKDAAAKKREELEKSRPAPLPTIATIRNEELTPVHLLNRGDYDSKLEQVGPRALGVLLPEGAPELPVDDKNPRTKLAAWITTDDHPLTPRVTVNRIWNYHFGLGIVKTANDFGFMGDRPSHPELLDYLANRFVEMGWKMKPIHRMILLSSAYRQASESPNEAFAMEKDPENRLVWKHSRRRVEAEELRDSMLVVSGKLNLKAGGPSVITPADEELVNLLYAPSQWKVPEDVTEFDRRSVYLVAKRNLHLPFMEVFDKPAFLTTCARRDSSTHPPQALELLNGDTSNRLAEDFAERLLRESGTNAVEQAEHAYLLATGRRPTPEERKLAVEFLATQPLREFALAMFNLNAFLYIN
jgi:hypothetical protein